MKWLFVAHDLKLNILNSLNATLKVLKINFLFSLFIYLAAKRIRLGIHLALAQTALNKICSDSNETLL